MSRIGRYLSTAAVAITAMAVPATASNAAASAGTSTSSTVTTPAAVSGLSLKGVTSARDGGIYYAFQNATGDNYTIVKQKADKSFDSTFAGTGSAAVAGVPLASQNRRILLTSDLNGKWWAVSTFGTSSGTAAVVSTGTATSATVTSATFTAATLGAKCAAAYPTSTATGWFIQNVNIGIARSGAWLTMLCTATNTVEPSNGSAIVALKSDLTFNSAITPIGTSAAHGSSATCVGSSSFVTDPTGASDSPEIWVFRVEHTNKSNNLCQVFSATAASITGYDVLRISSNGTVTRTAIASGGDAVDAQYSGRLDPGGRLVLAGTSTADPTKLLVARVKTDGTLDTTIGTAGFKTLSIGAVPAGATSVRANVNGLVTSSDTVYLSIMLTDQPVNSFSCQSTNPITWGWRAAMVSLTDGFETTFGTAGVGSRVTAQIPEGNMCNGFTSGASSVAADGTPRIISATTTGFALHEWAKLAGATGGTDGGTGTGGYTKDTGGAPSLGESAAPAAVSTVLAKLPVKTSLNSAYKVQTAAKAKTFRLATITPATCIGTATHVIAVAKGTCTVQVRAADGSVVRTLRSTIAAKGGTSGSSVEAVTLTFKAASTKITAAHEAVLAGLASKVAGASATVVVGYAASLTDNKAGNEFIARNRAKNVAAVLAQASPKANVGTVNMGVFVSEAVRKIEASQKNFRRAVVYIIQ